MEDKVLEQEQSNQKTGEQTEKKHGFFRELLSLAGWCIGTILVCFLCLEFVAQRTVVIGSSMMDTLHDGDSLIVNKISYRFKEPERFDIIVFPYQYDEDTHYIKRIIGLPGETVRIDEEGNIYIDGELLEESYGREVIKDPGLAIEPVTLGDDEYFVLGDNRNGSSDSRFEDVGNIHRDDIVGKAWVRIYPFDSIEVIGHQ